MCNTVIIRSLSFWCKKRTSKSELLNLVAVGGGVDRAEMWTKSVHFLDCTLALGHSSLWEKHYPLALVLLDRGNRGSGFKELGCNQKIQLNSPCLNNHARSLICSELYFTTCGPLPAHEPFMRRNNSVEFCSAPYINTYLNLGFN